MNKILSELIYPNPNLIVGLILLMVFDFFSGIRSATKRGEATTSKGMRGIFEKGSTYVFFVASLMVLMNITNIADSEKKFSGILDFSLDAVMLGACYIEFKSIMENLIFINTKEDGKVSDFATYFLIPLHKLLILKLLTKKQEKDEA